MILFKKNPCCVFQITQAKQQMSLNAEASEISHKLLALVRAHHQGNMFSLYYYIFIVF